MRILLQQKETGLYVGAHDDWSRDCSAARDFVSSSAAIDFCNQSGLQGIQLVLRFDEQKYDIVVPLIGFIPASRQPQPRCSPA